MGSRISEPWQAYPAVPWLEPDIVDHLDSLSAQGVESVIDAPIGFVSDHMNV